MSFWFVVVSLRLGENRPLTRDCVDDGFLDGGLEGVYLLGRPHPPWYDVVREAEVRTLLAMVAH